MTVVVTNYYGRAVLFRTIETVRAALGPQTPAIVADDGSDDGSLEELRRQFPMCESCRRSGTRRS